MKPEPLKNKKINIPDYNNVYPEDSVADAVIFYKRYQNDIKRLMEEHNKIWSEYTKYFKTLSDVNQENHLEKYNNWLFNYAFSDVVKSDDLFW